MEYTNLADMFARLNKIDCEYVVLRNYSNLLENEIYMSGHGDVDMLCRDVKEVVNTIGAKTCRPHLKFEMRVNLIALLVKIKHAICRW